MRKFHSKYSFKNPTIVKWTDCFEVDEGGKPIPSWGIAIGSNVICSCCGSLLSIKEINEMADDCDIDESQEVIIPYSWVDFTDKISENVKVDSEPEDQ